MDTPSLSRIPCITIDDDEEETRDVPMKLIQQRTSIKNENKRMKPSTSSNPNDSSSDSSESMKSKPKQSTIKNEIQNIWKVDSTNMKKNKLRAMLNKLNRARTRESRIRNYYQLRGMYPQYLKKVIFKLTQIMSKKNQQDWMCTGCSKTYKQKEVAASHLIIDHCWKLEYEPDDEEKVAKRKDNKTQNLNNVSMSERGEIQTTDQPPIDDRKIRLYFIIYMAKSFPMSNLELLRELFNNLNWDISIFTFLTENQNEFKEYVSNTISANFVKHLVRDVGASIFSIFVNQYTIKDEKMLLLVMKYFSKEKNQIHTSFYRLIKIQSENYANQIIDVLKRDNFNIAKCGGFGLDINPNKKNLCKAITDDLNNVHHRVVINRCIFQAPLLIIQKACSHLPEKLRSVILKINQLFMSSKKINKIWKSGDALTDFIIANWQIIKQEVIQNNLFGNNGDSVISDDDSMLLKRFLLSIFDILQTLFHFGNSLSSNLYDPFDIFENLRNILIFLNKKKIEPETNLLQGWLKEFTEKKYEFIKSLVSQLEILLPQESSNLLHQVTCFRSQNLNTKSQIDTTNIFKVFDLLPEIHFIQKEWHLLLKEDERVFPKDTTENCWMKIKESPDYKNISQFVLYMLCLPFSNFEVKRIFEQVAEFIKKAKGELTVEIAQAFLIIQCENKLNFLDICSE